MWIASCRRRSSLRERGRGPCGFGYTFHLEGRLLVFLVPAMPFGVVVALPPEVVFREVPSAVAELNPVLPFAVPLGELLVLVMLMGATTSFSIDYKHLQNK
ncbi:MAG: hypothetical protein J3R72DRAFT_232402 [Linnemannia gamsii]|nr:MAG: hypothetical protein J3R72DRAFT_232402 [Linnemannia gamsii]